MSFGPFADEKGNFMTQLVNVNPRAVINKITQLRCGYGSNIELFQYTSPDQDQRFRRNSDWGAHHIALYVRHIDKGVDFLPSKTGTKLFGPVTLRRRLYEPLGRRGCSIHPLELRLGIEAGMADLAAAQAAAGECSPEHKLAVLRALHESGVLDLPDQPHDDHEPEEEAP